MLLMAIGTDIWKLCLMWRDIDSKIVRVNRAYFARIQLLKSQRVSRNTKFEIHNIQIPALLTSQKPAELTQSNRKCSDYLNGRK
jgi:hypothetical protein